MPRKKALIIGINYFGTKHQLHGCINDAYNCQKYLIEDRGYSPAAHDMVVLTDEPKNKGTPFEPTGENTMKAFNWLVTCNNPGDSIWLSYSGHGSQVKDPDGDRESGFDDTICPLDFETNGQIDSDTLHKALVSPMDPRVRMTVLFDCCHSGSAIELPFVYRPNSQGEVNLVDNIKKGISLATQAYALMHGHFTAQKIKDAQMLIGGAKSLLASFQHRPDQDQKLSEDGLGEENFVEDWKNEGKDVWMFSGCADDQTSADTSIAGAPTGAMSHALINTLRENPNQSYIQVLQSTRGVLAGKYQQIPQLSCGGEYDLDQPVSTPPHFSHPNFPSSNLSIDTNINTNKRKCPPQDNLPSSSQAPTQAPAPAHPTPHTPNKYLQRNDPFLQKGIAEGSKIEKKDKGDKGAAPAPAQLPPPGAASPRGPGGMSPMGTMGPMGGIQGQMGQLKQQMGQLGQQMGQMGGARGVGQMSPMAQAALIRRQRQQEALRARLLQGGAGGIGGGPGMGGMPGVMPGGRGGLGGMPGAGVMPGQMGQGGLTGQSLQDALRARLLYGGAGGIGGGPGMGGMPGMMCGRGGLGGMPGAGGWGCMPGMGGRGRGGHHPNCPHR